MEQETAITLWSTGLSGFTRKRNANPFAGPETTNQSMHTLIVKVVVSKNLYSCFDRLSDIVLYLT